MRFSRYLIPLFVSFSSFAAADINTDGVRGVYSLGSSFSHLGDAQLDTFHNTSSTISYNSARLSYTATESLQIGLGVQQGDYRLMLEGYIDRANIKLNDKEVHAAKRRSRSAFYTSYLITPISNKFTTVLGAGFGYGEVELLELNNQKFSEGAALVKFSFGTEYYFTDSMNFFLKVENIIQLQKMKILRETENETIEKNLDRRLDTHVNAGVSYLF